MKKIFLIINVVIFASCSNNNQNNMQISEAGLNGNSSGFSQTKNGITVKLMDESIEYNNAIIQLKSPDIKKTQTAGQVKFSFQVDNYILGNQTPGASGHQCANSAKGQHIHYILDNQPYKAFYTTDFEEALTEGNHTVLAFLSRSYHESIKTKQAYTLFNLDVQGKAEITSVATDLKAQHLFYSRPKGEYVGNDTKKIMLDFYLVNTKLSEAGNKVKAIINGTEFILTDWKPYSIEGLPIGENKIQLQLIDKTGKLIPGPFNDSGLRIINLKTEEPIVPLNK